MSVAHCSEMLPPESITGVLVRDFEESSFFPGATVIPDRNDPTRYTTELEVDEREVDRRMGGSPKGPQGHAVALTFVGRRTRNPFDIDCRGVRYYTFVVDRLEAAQFLGYIEAADPPPLPSERPPYKPFKRSGAGGVIGQMEEETLARCSGSATPRG